MHVARTDLQNIRVLCAYIDILWRHYLGNRKQTMLLPGFSHHNQAFHPYALEAVRARTRLKCSDPQHLAACRLHQAGDFIDLLCRFHSARTAHNDKLSAANLHIADLYDRILRMEITAGQLIGFGNFNHILHALHLTQMLGKLRLNRSDQPDHRTVTSA
ncbi:hypothetical protein D3C77_327010 [compost metagenome]